MNLNEITRKMLLDTHPCHSAVVWMRKHPDAEFRELWDICPHGDWLLWVCREFDLLDNRMAAQISCAIVRETPIGDGRTVWDLLDDECSRQAIIVTEQWLAGEATIEDVKQAARAVRTTARTTADAADAAYAARAAADAAAYAAYAADVAAEAAEAARAAADAAADAADVAAEAADAAYAADVAADAAADAADVAEAAARAKQAEIVRRYVK